MKPAAHVRASITSDGVILMDIHTGQIFSANRIAARIWNGLEEGLSIDVIVHRIAADTGADASIVERDACEFVTRLRAHALVADI